jgi:NSS family neurotransmitter:Na+ symporter
MQSWTSRLGVILAVTGSAVGLGNFLKFPGQLATYGGGFMIPYLVCLLVIGLPIAWIEWSMGRQGGRRGVNSVPGVLLALTGRRRLAMFGALAPLIPLMIYTYYIVVEAWCLVYAWRYLCGGFGFSDAGQYGTFFSSFTGVGADDGALFANGELLAAVAICGLLNMLVVWRGIAKGIELVCTWGMPLLVLLALAVVARVLTMEPVGGRTVVDALGATWDPASTFTADDGATRTVTLLGTLTDHRAWLAAAGQIFFTLSLGMGVLITYASYMKPDDDVALSATTAAAGNEFCEVALGGMMSIPAAFLFLGPAVLVAVPGLFGLGFVALPNVFDAMPGGAIFGFLFFALLFLAAITSSLSMIQPAMAFLEEGFGRTRHAAVWIVAAITTPGVALVLWLGKGFTALDTIDFWMGNLAILVFALFTTIVFAHVLGADKGLAELRRGAEIPVPSWFAPTVRWITPAVLVAVLVAFLAGELQGGGRIAALADRRVALPFAYIALCTALFLWLGRTALPRLQARIDGGRP